MLTLQLFIQLSKPLIWKARSTRMDHGSMKYLPAAPVLQCVFDAANYCTPKYEDCRSGKMSLSAY
jgi:hypothetical protein